MFLTSPDAKGLTCCALACSVQVGCKVDTSLNPEERLVKVFMRFHIFTPGYFACSTPAKAKGGGERWVRVRVRAALSCACELDTSWLLSFSWAGK